MLFKMIYMMFVGFTLFASSLPDKIHQLSVGVNGSKTLSIPNIQRVAVGNSKLLKVQALPPSTLLIIGKKAGTTVVRSWNGSGKEFVHNIRIIASEAETQAQGAGRDVVKISLEFLELDEAFNQSTGFRWPEMLQFAGVASLTGNANVSGVNYEVGLSSAKGWISHLVKEGWARMVANPDLYVRLGEQAVFHSGGEFPVASSSQNYGQSYKKIEWKPYGLTAKVRPQSGDRLHISSDIDLEVSELSLAQGMDGVPALTRRHLETKMNSRDGQTVILSGLVKTNTSADKEGIPFLSSIPLIGALFFSSKSQVARETELLMAVTFSMTTNSKENQYRDKFDEKFKNLRDL